VLPFITQGPVNQASACKNIGFTFLYIKMQLEILLSIAHNLVNFMRKFGLSFSEPEYKFKVPRTNFFPQPNVSDMIFKYA